MNFKGNKFVSSRGFYARRVRPIFSSVSNRIREGCETVSNRIRNPRKSESFKFSSSRQPKGTDRRKKILDPQGSFLRKWNRIFVLACVIALSLDPLFFYIPVVDGENTCLDVDKKMETTACVLRSLIDAFYILHIIFQFRTGFIASSSRVFGRVELVDDPLIIAKKYLTSYFIIDVLSILPLPQVIILTNIKTSVSLVAKGLLKIVIWSQYVPRFIRIFPLLKEVTRSYGVLTETAWAGAFYNLFLYMLASHVIGAFWYLFSIERQDDCWQSACKEISGCHSDELYCGADKREGKFGTSLKEKCPFIQPDEIKNSSVFNFGIFIDAFDSGVIESWPFRKKFLFCLWWGLRNLSSLGQNLKTSNFDGEILFAVGIAVAGLVLFSLFIGNMQKYLQSTPVKNEEMIRIEEMRVKRRDTEHWMSQRGLPESLRERIRRYEQCKWQETRGVEEQYLIRDFPRDLRRDINRHLYFALIMRIPIFTEMDGQILDAICDRMRPSLYTADIYILREGEPVNEMIFIIRGEVVSTTTNGGRTGFFNAFDLKAGDFCGERLLEWALDPRSTSILPISTRTVRAVTEVEAIALVAEDLKSVTSQFPQLHHKDIQHTIRFFSVQWRTWAACFIQAEWRRHCKRKQAKALREAEERLQGVLAHGAASIPSLGATLYASRFAGNALRNLRQNVVPQKP